MTAEQARAAVGDTRQTLSMAMRALSVPGPDWGTAAGRLLDAAREASDLALMCLDESEGTGAATDDERRGALGVGR